MFATTSLENCIFSFSRVKWSSTAVYFFSVRFLHIPEFQSRSVQKLTLGHFLRRMYYTLFSAHVCEGRCHLMKTRKLWQRTALEIAWHCDKGYFFINRHFFVKVERFYSSVLPDDHVCFVDSKTLSSSFQIVLQALYYLVFSPPWSAYRNRGALHSRKEPLAFLI